MNTEFRERLARAINCFSMENGSNTPDFVLAQFLVDCLCAFDKAAQHPETRWRAAAAAKAGDRVRYMPNHAHGDIGHPDCEDGVVVTVREAITFVQFATGGPKACTPSDLVVTQSMRMS